MADNLLYKQTWLELIFKDKNKVYGAYFLRQLYEKNIVKALLTATTIFALAVAAPVLNKYLFPEKEEEIEKTVIAKVANLEDVPPPQENLPPPPVIEQPKVEMKEFLAPEPTPDELVQEDPPPIEELKNTNVGDKTQEGDPNAAFVVDDTPIQQAVEIVKDEYDINDVEEIPTYPGGNPALFKLFGNNIKYPKQAMSRDVQGTVTVAVTVSSDGSISNIRVAKGLGYGLDEEAVRLAKMMSNWIPAKMNGRSVKIGTMYIPIKFALDDSEE